MNKHTGIVIAAVIVIAGALGFSVWNIFASEQVQIRGVEEEGYFSFFNLINNKDAVFCNPLPVPINLKETRISMMYADEEVGTIHFPQFLLDGNLKSQVHGNLVSENFKQMQYLGLHFDGMYNGVIPSRIDLNSMNIIVEYDTPIFGVIPYTVTEQFPGLNFWNFMNNKNTEHTC